MIIGNTGKKQTKVFCTPCMWETLYQRFGASGNLV